MARADIEDIDGKKETIVSEVKKHGNKSAACRVAGISQRTLYNWTKKDSAFESNINKAHADCLVG